MKKLTLIIVGLIVALTLQAQLKEHMKFMGIPLNDTINQFQTKLTAKGFKLNTKLNKEIGSGCRSFLGSFSGEDATVFVYYNPKTKVVYRAKAVIECLNSEKGENKLNDFKYLISEKYPSGIAEDGNQEGHPSFLLYLNDSKGKFLGVIGLYITNNTYSYMDEVYLHIDYVDNKNDVDNSNRKLDDL